MNWAEVLRRCANPFFGIAFILSFPIASFIAGVNAAVDLAWEMLR